MSVTNGAAAQGEIEHELDAPPWLRVESTLIGTANAIKHAYDERLACLGLNLSTASVISYVAEFGPVSQTRVAEHLDQGRAVTGTQIDRLEREWIVERRTDPNDRRVWLVAITAEGEKVAEAIAEVDRALRSELRSGITRTERQQLADTLVRLQQNLHPPINPSKEATT